MARSYCATTRGLCAAKWDLETPHHKRGRYLSYWTDTLWFLSLSVTKQAYDGCVAAAVASGFSWASLPGDVLPMPESTCLRQSKGIMRKFGGNLVWSWLFGVMPEWSSHHSLHFKTKDLTSSNSSRPCSFQVNEMETSSLHVNLTPKWKGGVPGDLRIDIFGQHLQEKETSTHKLTNHTLWGQMLNGLIQLALAEKTYASLMFLGLKWFGRKDVSLKQDLRSVGAHSWLKRNKRGNILYATNHKILLSLRNYSHWGHRTAVYYRNWERSKRLQASTKEVEQTRTSTKFSVTSVANWAIFWLPEPKWWTCILLEVLRFSPEHKKTERILKPCLTCRVVDLFLFRSRAETGGLFSSMLMSVMNRWRRLEVRTTRCWTVRTCASLCQTSAAHSRKTFITPYWVHWNLRSRVLSSYQFTLANCFTKLPLWVSACLHQSQTSPALTLNFTLHPKIVSTADLILYSPENSLLNWWRNYFVGEAPLSPSACLHWQVSLFLAQCYSILFVFVSRHVSFGLGLMPLCLKVGVWHRHTPAEGAAAHVQLAFPGNSPSPQRRAEQAHLSLHNGPDERGSAVFRFFFFV